MCGNMVDIQSPTAEIRRGNKKRRKKERQTDRRKPGFYICSSSFLAVSDWMSTILQHMICGLSANLECTSEMCYTWLAENTGRENDAKNGHLGTIAQLCREFGAPQLLSTASASWQRYCTASSSGRQPNCAALNRGRRLCSAGRPSHWALAHILVLSEFFVHVLLLDIFIINQDDDDDDPQSSTIFCASSCKPI